MTKIVPPNAITSKFLPLSDIPELKESMRRLIEKYSMTLGYYVPEEGMFYVKGSNDRVYRGNSMWELEWHYVRTDTD